MQHAARKVATGCTGWMRYASTNAKRLATPKEAKRSKQGLNSYQKGEELESRVARLFQLQGYQVKKNVLIRNSQGCLSELDIVATSRLPWRSTRYIECKNYARPLPLHAVANFKEVLLQNSLPLHQALLVTTATLTPRVRSAGIQVWDGKQLLQAEAQAARCAARSWYIRILTLMCGSYVLVLLATPGLAVAVQGVVGSPQAPQTASPVLKSVINLLLMHRKWWGNTVAHAAESELVKGAVDALPEPASAALQRVAQAAARIKDDRT